MIKSIKDYSLEIIVVIMFLIVLFIGVCLISGSCDREPLLTPYEINELVEECE